MNRLFVVLLCCISASLLIEVSCGQQTGKLLGIDKEHQNVECDIDELENQGHLISYCPDNDLHIQHKGKCDVIDMDTGDKVEVQCFNGQWINSGTSIAEPHGRTKRFIGTLIGALIGAGIVCAFLCGKDKAKVIQVQKYPPTFKSNCTPDGLLGEYTAQIGTESARVSWKDPSATDKDGTVQSVRQVSGTKNGELFPGTPTGNKHTIMYEARDNDNLTATCRFSFKVKVATCTFFLWPENGYRKCPKDNILGSSCQYGCNAGYHLSPDINSVTCESTPTGPAWTTVPTCEKLTCGKPPEVVNGYLTCTDPYLSYGSYCTVSCVNGFRLNGQVFTRCEAGGNWSWQANCTDDTPPEMSCRTPQVFYANRGSLVTSVIWEEPTATDNIDRYPTLTQLYGPDQNVSVEAGTSEFVQYKATDSSGNESPPCIIELRVLELSCGHPLDAIGDPRLRFNCTMSTYTHGDTCTLKCDLNLPLEGSESISCEVDNTVIEAPKGVWDWNGDMPFCREIECPDLEPPRNGALVYDTINTRPVSVMLCNEKFDIPDEGSNFVGIFLCQDSGTWIPNYNKAPDCIEPISSRGFRLLSKFFYYNGTCGSDDNIKEQFNALVADLNKEFHLLCPPTVTCTAVNSETIVCGETNRKKRSTVGDLSFSFDIQTDFTDFNYTGMSREEIFDFVDNIQLNVLKPAIQEKVYNGSFDLPAWTMEDDFFQTDEYGDWYCDPGYSRRISTNVCKPCSIGRYEKKGVCTVCPVGNYSNTAGSVNCTKCLDGYSTRHEASESSDNCTKLCGPGSYSPDTFAPCAHCKVGFYQTQTGQTNCIACPTGKTTTKTGSTAVTDCQYFDVLIVNTGGRIPVAEGYFNDITVMFWTKKASTVGSANVVVSIEDHFDIVIADSIKVYYTYDGAQSHDLGPLSSEAWVHVTVSLAVTDGILSAYYKGVKVVSSQSVSTTHDAMVHLTVNSNTTSEGIKLSDVRLLDRVISDADVIKAAEYCHLSENIGIVNMDHFKNMSKLNINMTTPSQCDANNDCEGSPCGSHKCIDEMDGFTCVCQHGWSGPKCSTPPQFCTNNDCTNGATCISGLTEYICQCQPGYSGVFCEIPPVDGAWSAWSSWSDCTMTCNSGTQQRVRACDSPTPGNYGKDCEGVTNESRSCNTLPCPECPVLKRAFGNQLNCRPTDGSKSCSVTCNDGYMLPGGLQTDNYTCGIDTNYVWQPFGNVPDCVKPDHVDRFEIAVSVNYKSHIRSSDEQAVKDAIAANVLGTECYNTVTCKTSVKITQSSHGETSGSNLSLSLQIALTDSSDLQLDAFIVNGTVSTSLQETIDAVNNLEATAIAINSSASVVFDLNISDTLYTIDSETVTFSGSASCPSGQVADELVCVKCPPGTYQNDDHCSYCEKDTFQSQTGQSACVPCPSGYTTVTIGSQSSLDCTEHTITLSSSTTLPTSTRTMSTTSSFKSDLTSTTPMSLFNTTTITSSDTRVSSTSAETTKQTQSTDASTSRKSTQTTLASTSSVDTSDSAMTSATTRTTTRLPTPFSTSPVEDTSRTPSSSSAKTSKSTTPTTLPTSASTSPVEDTSRTQSSTSAKTSKGTTQTTLPTSASTSPVDTSRTSSSSSSMTSKSTTPTTLPAFASSTAATVTSSRTSSVWFTGSPTTNDNSGSSVGITSTDSTPTSSLSADNMTVYVGVPIAIVLLVIAGLAATLLYRRKCNRSNAKEAYPTISSAESATFDDILSKSNIRMGQSNA